ncbi:MAG: BREX system Lon protease-like protein BrxL [Candidatus Heimdallarchaeota archaeon]
MSENIKKDEPVKRSIDTLIEDMISEDSLNEKLLKVFPEFVVDKKLSQLQEIKRLPRFVSEYLLIKFCKDGVTKENLAKLSDFVHKFYPERKEKDRIKTILMRFGSYKLLDEFKVETDINRGIQKVWIPCLDIRNARIVESLLYQHENLLIDGMWGVGNLVYVPDSDTPVLLTEFTPFQISKLDFNVFLEGRESFSTKEWIDVLINSVGLNPRNYSDRTKLVLLSRLIPLVESNVNIVELGPKGTGKTFLFRNVSYHSRIISGGQITPATLFVNLSTQRLGLLAIKDCIVLDEVSTIQMKYSFETIGKLKDYMESGNFDRGTKQIQSDTSLIMVGNIPVKDGYPSIEPLFEVFPTEMRETAFIDRFNGFIPGWELPRIQQSEKHLAKNYGFVSDYFAEILHELRKIDFNGYISKAVQLDNADIRDEKSIKKIGSGMLKLLSPNGLYSEMDLRTCMDLAVEYRQRIIDQLHHMAPGEFKAKRLAYRIES